MEYIYPIKSLTIVKNTIIKKYNSKKNILVKKYNCKKNTIVKKNHIQIIYIYVCIYIYKYILPTCQNWVYTPFCFCWLTFSESVL